MTGNERFKYRVWCIAIAIAACATVCLANFLVAWPDGWGKAAVWLTVLIGLVLGVLSTRKHEAFALLLIALIVCLWIYGDKQKGGRPKVQCNNQVYAVVRK